MVEVRMEIEEIDSLQFVRGEDVCEWEECQALAHALLLVEFRHEDGTKETYNKVYCSLHLADSLELIKAPALDLSLFQGSDAEVDQRLQETFFNEIDPLY